MKERAFGSGQVAPLGGVSSQTLKVCGFEPRSGHVRGRPVNVSLFSRLLPSLPSSRSKINKHNIREGFLKKFFKKGRGESISAGGTKRAKKQHWTGNWTLVGVA